MEIELKFDIKELPSNFLIKNILDIKQSYIYLDKYTTIRKRIVKNNNETKYFYTVKCDVDQIDKIGCHEIENTIDDNEYFNLSILKGTREISKRRLIVELKNNLKAEIDVFNDELDGYITIEVEFNNYKKLEEFDKPSWFGDEINLSNRKLSLMKKSELKKLTKHIQIKQELEKNVYNWYKNML